MRAETSFLHPTLRRLEPQVDDTDAARQLRQLLGSWVRVVLCDGRAFVGALEALDGAVNLVLSNPVEVRPGRGPTGELDASAPVETKSHRGCVMVAGDRVVSIARRREQPMGTGQ